MIGDWVGQALNPQRVCESKGSPDHTNPPNPQALLSEIFVLRLPMDPRPADQKFPKICEKSRNSVKSRGALGRGFCELERIFRILGVRGEIPKIWPKFRKNRVRSPHVRSEGPKFHQTNRGEGTYSRLVWPQGIARGGVPRGRFFFNFLDFLGRGRSKTKIYRNLYF